MAGPWSTEGDVKQLIADTLVKDVGEIPLRWSRLAHDANIDAANDITEILLGKGYTQAQIDSWDARQTYNRDIAAHLALVKGGACNDYNQTTIDKLDRRKMLRELVGLMINGTLVIPGASDDTGNGVGIGVIDDSNYRFNMDTVL